MSTDQQQRGVGGGVALRTLGQADATVYREFMLDAYARHPDAFTSSAAERAALPLAWWQSRLAGQAEAAEVVLGALCGDTLLGVAGLRFPSAHKTRHKSTLFGMAVALAARRHGIGRSLVGAALGTARATTGVRLVQLTVSVGNDAARGLYESCGFRSWGVEPMAVALEHRFVAKVHLWREL